MHLNVDNETLFNGGTEELPGGAKSLALNTIKYTTHTGIIII